MKNTIEDLKGKVELIEAYLPETDKYEKPIWEGIKQLILESNFGSEGGEVEIDSSLPFRKSNEGKILSGSGSFAGLILKMHPLCKNMMSDFGDVSCEQYSKGSGTGSLKFTFEPYY